MAAVAHQHCIAVVEDEPALREAADSLLRSAGFDTHTFASAEEFLSSASREAAVCLVLDVRLPGMSGLELQQHLLVSGCPVSIVIMTALEDVSGALRAQALRAGAVAILRKPFQDEDLLRAVRCARELRK